MTRILRKRYNYLTIATKNTLKKVAFYIYMNIFLKSAKSLGKIVILTVLAYLFLNYIIFAENKTQIGTGLFLLIFITLPTIYLIFFKKYWDVRRPNIFVKFWRVYRVFYYFFIVLLITAFAIGIWHLNEVAKTQKTVDFINSKRITMADVIGQSLPPMPVLTLNDSTIAGIDANNNYIRDDVELAIFEKYPDSPKIRQAMLQYAQALQLELTQVYSSETLVAVMKKESRGIDCIGKTGPEEKSLQGLEIINNRKKEVDDFVLNTDLRKKTELDNLNKYMAGYSSPPGNECDINVE